MRGIPEMAVVALLLMYLQYSLFMAAKAVNAGCECIVFDDTYGKEYGVFTSPNWPVPYEDNIDCLLYTFIGEDDEIVEVTFDEFDVQKTNLDCVFGDFVKLFLHLEEAAVNEDTPWNTVLCGKIADIEQTHYSSDQSLIFEFHTDWRHGDNTGFRGTYRFLSKKMFETDGELVTGSFCDYQFRSGNSSQMRGKFYSPQYPSTYPKNVQCAYTFHGKFNEKVKVVFEQIRLQRGDLSCLNSPDVIVVHDGKDTSSPVIGQLCNTNTFVEVVSTGPDLYIEFASKSHFPGQGFKGIYLFEEDAVNNGFDIPSTEPDNTGDKLQLTTTGQPLTNCDYWISSDTTKNGTFTSPNYPEPYPPKIQCSYHFTGRGKERVQILFSDFDLYHPEDSPTKECEAADVLMVFITINGQKERVDNFCGNDLPSQLMSNGPSMSVEFRSLYSSPNVKGFRAFFRFVTNFGIVTGKQDPQSVCGFIFKSFDRTNGTFTSPNWPGLYPRDTECHYFFYGRPNERVHITFAYFDVEGVTPCTTDTASDYVEFSNFRTVDRKIPRHCGLKKPKLIDSDGEFFRVTFKSNDRFDGTGFEAFYQFRNSTDTFTIKRMSGNSVTTGSTGLVSAQVESDPLETEEEDAQVEMEDPVVPEESAAAVTDKEDEEEEDEDEEKPLKPSPDADTFILFTKPPGMTLEIPAGKDVQFLVGFTNKGTRDFVLDTMDASFRYPTDFTFYIQNFSTIAYNKVVKPKQEATLYYTFFTSETFSSRPFGLTVNLMYRDADGNQYLDAVFNETVNIVELDEGLDGETFFLYVFLAACVVLLLVAGQQFFYSFGRRRHGTSKPKIEMGTSNPNDVDYDWIPKERLNEISKSPKKSPRQSPRQRRVKRGTGFADE